MRLIRLAHWLSTTVPPSVGRFGDRGVLEIARGIRDPAWGGALANATKGPAFRRLGIVGTTQRANLGRDICQSNFITGRGRQ